MSRSMREATSSNDRYFTLWERILVRLAEVVERGAREVDLDRLDRRAQELERAQRREWLRTYVVRELRKRDGALHPS